jgi:hypothetical protein
MDKSLDPNYGAPVNRVRKVIIYTLWTEQHGDCPSTSASSIDLWREAALLHYRNNTRFHLSVNAAVSAIMGVLHDD